MAFHSEASNLVPGDTNGKTDVFVYDRQTDTIEQVSVDGQGEQGNSSSSLPSISADGQYVAFHSFASDLVQGDTNGVDDVFVTTVAGAGLPGTRAVVLAPDHVVTGIEFGNSSLLPGEIRGTKWHDLDGDGLRDAGEPGLAGVTIYLDLDGNGQLDGGEPTAVTDADGRYSFTELDAGTYTVAEVVPDGYEQTFPTAGQGPTGELSFVEVLKDRQGGLDGLDGPQSVAVSPDGSHLYIAANVDDALTAFERDPTTGELTFVQVLYDGGGGDSPLQSRFLGNQTKSLTHFFPVDYASQLLLMPCRPPPS